MNRFSKIVVAMILTLSMGAMNEASSAQLLLTISLYTSITELVPAEKISTPESAARMFYGAWKRNDRQAALAVASRTAVKQLFKTRFTQGAPDWQFQGCEKRRGGYDCSYYYEGGSATMGVVGSRSTGFRVTLVKFIAD